MSSYTNDGGASAAQYTNAMDPVGMNSEKAEAARQKSAEVMAALKDGKPGEADAIMGKRDDMDKGPSVIDRMKKKIGIGGEKEEGDVSGAFGIVWLSTRLCTSA
ncbi:hypothetical protein LTR12_001430 [Friedmanniomyces endolithicus]|nr:hypothetical protein LTR12_001430 [Friedmanniomyces endolithicus]